MSLRPARALIAATETGLNFGSPEKPEVMWQFSEVIDGLTVACNELGTPITGGNVSFYNETLGKSIYPTPVIGILGILEDASRVLKIAFRAEGDVIVLLDGSNAVPVLVDQSSDAAREFSSSEYSKTIAGIVSGEPPEIDLAGEKRLIDCLVALATDGSVQSAHDISDGGFAVTPAESFCFRCSSERCRRRHAAPVLRRKRKSGLPMAQPNTPSLANAVPAASSPSANSTRRDEPPVLATARSNTVCRLSREMRQSERTRLRAPRIHEYKGARWSILDALMRCPSDGLRPIRLGRKRILDSR